MIKHFCDQCGVEFPGVRVIKAERDLDEGMFCSFNCLGLWAYERSVDAITKMETLDDIYGPDSDRRDPELLMEAADNERKARRESHHG